MNRLIPVGLLSVLVIVGCARSPGVVVVEGDSVAAAQPQPAKPDEPTQPVNADVGGTFMFADDAAGQLLAKTLTPAEPVRLAADPKAKPQPRAGLAALESPDLPLAGPNVALPTVPIATRSPLWPRALADAAPLEFFRADPEVPQRPELPPAVLVRRPAPDVNQPVDLAVQAKQASDRASLDDPTAEFSGERAVANPVRMRTAPAPFQRYDLPEPFERRGTSRLPPTEPPVVAPVPAPPK
jgi:hypothetical protein